MSAGTCVPAVSFLGGRLLFVFSLVFLGLVTFTFVGTLVAFFDFALSLLDELVSSVLASVLVVTFSLCCVGGLAVCNWK